MAGDVRRLDFELIGTVIIRRHHFAKHISIKVTRTGEVSVSAPPRTPLKYISLVVAQKKSWIIRQLRNNQLNSTPFRHDMPIGKYHRLIFQPRFDKSEVKSKLIDDRIVISYPSNYNIDTPEIQNVALKASVKALRSEAEEYLPKRLSELARQNGLFYTDCHLRNLKRKWGSCNSEKVITLNIWLMNLDTELIDYVLLHELNHTKHMHHQADFWYSMASLCPSYKDLRRQLRQTQTLGLIHS